MTTEYLCKNIYEDLVENLLDDCMQKNDMCRCDKCRADVKAYALNNLPTHYVVTAKGDLFARLKAEAPQSQADVIKAITHGLNAVKSNPRH